MSTHPGAAAMPGADLRSTRPTRAKLSLDGLHPAVSALLGSVSVLVAVLVLLDLRSPVRQLMVVAFLLAVPGATVIRLLRFQSLLFQCCAAVAVSLVIDMLLAIGLLELDLWNPPVAVALLAVCTAVLSAVPHLRGDRGRDMVETVEPAGSSTFLGGRSDRDLPPEPSRADITVQGGRDA